MAELQALPDVLDEKAAQTGFSGVVRVAGPDGVIGEAAYGLADRSHAVPMRPDTRLGIASGSKAFTALVVMALIDEGLLTLDTPARDVLGDDLPLIEPDVTVEHLLAHRSGIGDYLDEDLYTDDATYVLPVPTHRLVRTEDFLQVLGGFETRFAAGSDFRYCNGGYVVLALIAERVSGVSYHDLVRQRVCGPAGMVDTDFLRLDALPARAARGYVKMDGEWRSNVLHLPVVATGDGGIHTTAEDLDRFWRALFDGRIVGEATLQRMIGPRSVLGDGRYRYGLGFWLPAVDPSAGPATGSDAGSDADMADAPLVQVEGNDTGVSCRSRYDRRTGLVSTVIANDSNGAWPVAAALQEWLAASSSPA